MASADPTLENKNTLDVALAGASLYFMIIDIFLYWIILGFIEYGGWQMLKDKCSKKKTNKVKFTPIAIL